VTVHTDIAYSTVVGSTVTLNGVEIDHWKSDNRGNFVAKFEATDVKALFESEDDEADEPKFPITATLTLEGGTFDRDSFCGSDKVDIIKIVPRKR
jgi:hypothetical protein